MQRFSDFVSARRDGAFGGDGPTRYAFRADVAMLRAFRRMRPVELAAAAVVRAYKQLREGQMLGTMVRVGPAQLPRLHALAEQCARRLDVPTPAVFVSHDPRLNAYTFGTQEDSFIVLFSGLVDALEEDELRFVLGHEMGHIQNKHVVYGTVLRLLEQAAGGWLRWVLPPAELALAAWYRRAEITCDRAGLLCAASSDAPVRALVKMACGSRKLASELNVSAYLEQVAEGRAGIGRFAELFASHPYLPKRIEALRVFEQSALYREARGAGEGGLSMDEVDARTEAIVEVLGAFAPGGRA